MSDQPKDPGYCTPGYCSPSKHDQTPPVASSQQGRTVTAEEARDLVREVLCSLEEGRGSALTRTELRMLRAYIDQSEARIREVRERRDREMRAACELCEIYFKIAVGAIGEEAVRSARDAAGDDR